MAILLIDEDLPRSTGLLLGKVNIKIVDVRDCDLQGKSGVDMDKISGCVVIVNEDRIRIRR